MIKRLSHATRNNEVGEFASRVVDLYEKSGITDTPLASMFDKVKQLQIRMTSAVNRLLAESGLEEYNEVLDDKTRSLFGLVEGYTYHPNKKISTPAIEIMEVFDSYGLSIVHENYASQSMLTQSLITDMEKEDIVEKITKLSGCNILVDEVKVSLSNFKDNYLSYQEQKSADKEEASATELRKQLSELINGKLINYLNAMSNYSDEYLMFTDTFAQIVETNNDVVRRRRKKAKEEVAEDSSL